MIERDGNRMTISEHLDELRKRLLVCVVTVVACAIVAFWRIEDVVDFMRRPLDLAILQFEDGTVRLVQTKVFGGFLAAMKVAFFAGAVVAAPVVLMQMWGFISAGLYRHERRAVKYYALPGFGLFLSGAALAYFYVMPYAFDFLLGFSHEQLGVESMLDVSPYISLMAFAMLMFGLLFQLPVVMVFLMRIGVVEPSTFARYRRHAVVGAFALAMVLTPPDVVTQVALAASMAILYEAAIWFGRFIARPRSESGESSTGEKE
ncbi:MAG: twin-arginine translocase subunit TatC [Planctomycetota bacterium]|jgi:sec-independent protein translocase protein TatC